MIRRFGEPARPDRTYRLRPGVYVVLLRGDTVLATRKMTPVPELQLPGGGIDPGEQPIAALHREVLEETGWTIRIARRLGAFRRFTHMPEYDLWAEKLCTIYLGQPARRLGPPGEPGHSAIWLPLDTAARNLGNAGDRHFAAHALRTVVAGRTGSGG
ncbi:NUDIX hydrolase [Tropicimonas sp.]|uniref:NUDIX hydrolase n=1 Tax=Tropicimonas sp. TaxID=2067044 RepID=UPI003A85CA42